ncbi:MAG: Gfo/Idh/MocA family protein [Prevotella sp.]
MRIRVGLIGFGRMGRFWLAEFQKNAKYEVAYICDLDESCRTLARERAPQAVVTDAEDMIFHDDSVQLVALCANANSRKGQIVKAMEHGKYIVAEKPISDTVENEWKIVDMIKDYDKFTTVNLYLRNSWYHHAIKDFVATGEIGELAILRVCHMTPGLAPGEGHESEGPCFHDCGMHYVDIVRWYAGSEFKTWHAQALRMWDYKDPWWLQCHGTFENGVVFDVTQGFVYGQLSKDQTHQSYIDIIGTKGVAHMTHNFEVAQVELRGVNETLRLEKPFGGKNIDRLIDLMADSILSGRRDPRMPSFRDSAVASDYSWRFLRDAAEHDMPSIGNQETLKEIIKRRSTMTNGYGLLPHNNKKV